VRLDSFHAQLQELCDLLIAFSLGKQLHNLALTGSQPLHPSRDRFALPTAEKSIQHHLGNLRPKNGLCFATEATAATSCSGATGRTTAAWFE
jgi:hypothetical protein